MASWAGAEANDNPFADPAVAAARSSAAAAPAAPAASAAPSWLRGGQAAAPPPPPPPPPPAQAAWTQSNTGASPPRAAAGPPPPPTAAEAARQQKVPQLIIYMRVTNICLCVLLSATAVLELLTTPSLQQGVLAIYLFAFSCVLCCFETHLKVVAKTIAANFGFLYNAKGRAVFMLFVGIMCFSFQAILGYISGIAMIVNGVFNFYVIFRYPEIERDQQRKDLESEGRDFLRANRGNIAQAGADFARNNPEVAAKAAQHAAGTYV